MNNGQRYSLILGIGGFLVAVAVIVGNGFGVPEPGLFASIAIAGIISAAVCGIGWLGFRD